MRRVIEYTIMAYGQTVQNAVDAAIDKYGTTIVGWVRGKEDSYYVSEAMDEVVQAYIGNVIDGFVR